MAIAFILLISWMCSKETAEVVSKRTEHNQETDAAAEKDGRVDCKEE